MSGICKQLLQLSRLLFGFLVCACFITNKDGNEKNTRIADRLILPPQTVSYAQFLYPTNALVRQKNSGGGGAPDSCTAQTSQSRFRGNGQRSFTPARLNNAVPQDPCTQLSDVRLLLRPN